MDDWYDCMEGKRGGEEWEGGTGKEGRKAVEELCCLFLCMCVKHLLECSF